MNATVTGAGTITGTNAQWVAIVQAH